MVSIKNSLKLALQWIPNLKANKVDKSAIELVYTNKSLNATPAASSNWTISTCTADLAGNLLRIAVTAERSSATGVGNIDNEKICTITVNTQGYIKSADITNSVSSSDGGIAGFYTNNASVSGNTLTFDLNIGATHQAITKTNTWFFMQVVLNENAFL